MLRSIVSWIGILDRACPNPKHQNEPICPHPKPSIVVNQNRLTFKIPWNEFCIFFIATTCWLELNYSTLGAPKLLRSCLHLCSCHCVFVRGLSFAWLIAFGGPPPLLDGTSLNRKLEFCTPKTQASILDHMSQAKPFICSIFCWTRRSWFIQTLCNDE